LKKINDGRAISGDRPFYYLLRIYALIRKIEKSDFIPYYSRVGMSEDGGKSFQQNSLQYDGVHPDHHAWISTF